MRYASALAGVLAAVVGWYLLAPVSVLFGWTRRGFMRFCSWWFVLLAVCSIGGTVYHQWGLRIAWCLGWLAAAAIGFRFADGPRVCVPRSLSRPWQRPALIASVPADHGSHALVMLCERRIGRPVLAAGRVRMRTPVGMRTHVLALTSGVLWWVQIRPGQRSLGPIIAWRALDGLVVHSEPRRGGRHVLELSRPANGELLEGTLYGPGAARLVGQLTAEQFAHTHATVRAPGESR